MLNIIDVLARELLLFCAVCFLIGALDDLFVDLLWMGQRLRRVWSQTTRFARMTARDLPALNATRRAAIFIPAWHEQSVIGATLRRCLSAWPSQHYRIYVGCYPNDVPTIASIVSATRTDERVRLVLCARPGPTTKADCLNRLWQALRDDERGQRFDARFVVLHDAEDHVHPDALALFAHLIDRADLVQLPVIPMRERGRPWVAGHYADEFAEMHGKAMVVREAVTAAMPSAGVGCAIDRKMLGRLARLSAVGPFDPISLTEDYEVGLRIGQLDGRGIFVRMPDSTGALIATHAPFPSRLNDAVRQKSRWLTGIALAGWDRIGWSWGWRENWMRLRDRKASFAALVLALAYASILLWSGLSVAALAGLHDPAPLSPMLRAMLLANAAFLIWRMIWRAAFTARIYGFREGAIAIPRTFVSNIINIMAARRAVALYVRYLFGRPLVWEKTQHSAIDEASIVPVRTPHGKPDRKRSAR